VQLVFKYRENNGVTILITATDRMGPHRPVPGQKWLIISLKLKGVRWTDYPQPQEWTTVDARTELTSTSAWAYSVFSAYSQVQVQVQVQVDTNHESVTKGSAWKPQSSQTAVLYLQRMMNWWSVVRRSSGLRFYNCTLGEWSVVI